MTEVAAVRVVGSRLWDAHMEMAAIGALPGGGCCRLALTDEDQAARDLFVGWCREAGCTISVDQAGNIFATRAGRRDASPVVMGSHLDTQPHGGRFDGIFGVLAGLEALRSLNDAGVETDLPLALVNWTGEEGVRFRPGLCGSTAFAGGGDAGPLHDQVSNDGKRFGDELARIGYLGAQPLGAFPIDAYFEAHIEQGPVLEREGDTIGVVTGAQGLRWIEVTATGSDRHAGTTPMEARRDALVAAARMVVELHALGRAHAPDARVTVGRLNVEPNAPSTIPGQTRFLIDLRHPETRSLDQLETEITDLCGRIAETSSVEMVVRQVMSLAPVQFDAECVQLVANAAERLGYRHRRMPSGALHDACAVSRRCPAAMIFVPSRDGISHSEAEWTEPAHLEAGANVLLHAMLARAGVPSQ